MVWTVGSCWLLAGSRELYPAADPEPAQAKQPAQKERGLQARFIPAGGVFTKPVSLQLSSSDPALTIRFTLDGSDPSDQAEGYQKDLRLSATTLVKARVFKGREPAGETVSQTYTVIEPELEKFRSRLPVVIINTFGREILHSEKIPASVLFLAPQGGVTTLQGSADFAGRGDLHLRGKSSLRYLKRSYGYKSRDDAGQALSFPILGFPKDSDWILYAPYPDKTLLRDVLAYDLSRQMGQPAMRTRFVEVFVNQVGGKLSMRHYTGVFVLEEKIKRSKDRVNIQKLGPEDNSEPNLTGGYIFKKDHEEQWGEVTPTVDGRPMGFGGNSGPRYGYPTGPGGFPADPAGFQAPLGGIRRGGNRTAETSPNGPNIAPDSTTFLDRLRMALSPNDGQPPPQPGAPAPRGRTPGELPPDPTRPPDPANPGRPPEQFTFRGDGGFIRGDGVIRSFRGAGAGAEEGFRTARRNEFYYVEPKPDEITPAQRAWLRSYVTEFERVLYGPEFRDPTKGYAAYIDIDSFIDHHLMVEVTKNIDGFRFSTFYSKDRGGKMRMQPIWDWNLSFGNANGKQGWMPEYWYWPQLDDTQYSWFRRLFEDPDFGQRYVDRWGELRTTVFSVSNMLGRIDVLVAELGDARKRNFERWPILSRRIWPNTFVGQTYEDEINNMKDFIRKRLAWIDQQFVAAPVASREKGSGASAPVTLTAATGRVYFTLDGTDPRAAGGTVAPQARPYSGPVTVPEKGKLYARAFVDNRWSPPARL